MEKKVLVWGLAQLLGSSAEVCWPVVEGCGHQVSYACTQLSWVAAREQC